MRQPAKDLQAPVGERKPVCASAVVHCLAALLGFFPFGLPNFATAQNIFDLAEINGDLRILGDERYDFVGEQDSMAVFDFNDSGKKDLFLIRGEWGSAYGFFDVNFDRTNTFIDTRTEKPDVHIPYNISGYFILDRLHTCDMNNDGIKDLILASTYSYSPSDSSKIFILFSSSSWVSPITIDLSTNQADLTILYGRVDDVDFGRTMASGDINDDGIDDLVIGAYNAENPAGHFYGAVYVIYGSTDFAPNEIINLAEEPADITYYGEPGNFNFGFDVATGDVNGDGIDDVLVGALSANADQYGRVYVFYGSDSFPPGHFVDLTSESADITIRGPHEDSKLGRSVTSGDINGDGVDDICCGANLAYSPDDIMTGAVYLIYGREDFPPEATIDLETEQADITCYGEMYQSIVGLEMKAGDLDNDGFDEWAIFSYDSETLPDRQGMVHILRGSDGYPAHHVIEFAETRTFMEIHGDDPEDWLSLSGEITDVNLDGYADLLLGAEGADRDTERCGEGYILLGRSPLDAPPRFVAGPGPHPSNGVEIRLFDPRSTAAWCSRFEPYSFTGYGANAAAGDLDGDGYDEVVTGPGPGPEHPPLVRGYSPEGDFLFGFPAYGVPRYGVNVTAGDLDGDGTEEIITGAGPGAVYGPHVRGWRWDGGSTVATLPGVSFIAYGTRRWGVNVACGDIDGDGRDEIVTGAGPGDVFGPHVRGWDYYAMGGTRPIGAVSYFAYGTLHWGVNVACGDIDGDGIDEIVTGPGPSRMFSSHVRGWNYDGESLEAIDGVNFIAYSAFPSSFGCRVACGDVDNDRVAEILTSPGPHPDNPAYLKTWNYDGGELTLRQDRSFLVFEKGAFVSGANVALGNFFQDSDDPP